MAGTAEEERAACFRVSRGVVADTGGAKLMGTFGDFATFLAPVARSGLIYTPDDMMSRMAPRYQIRADYDARTTVVYQAYSPAIADAVLR